ncbi:MAG: DNA replication/repair protein RecF [Gammaproteobacteria bacterium]|jgi:DNA replication and repair protein RecF|nr:DNA replication/repair protein RecF [Gammaproteobacteria bacterium]NDF86372.1 DNA replication/repair protein RecF [Gammaproteobacteria bacterium]
MSLAELTLENLRCIEKAELSLGPGTTLIFGANGAGKTSILEAAYLLGRGRSFRTRLNERLIRHGQAFVRVVGRVNADPADRKLGVEVQRAKDGKGGTTGRLDGSDVRSFADLATAFPVQAMDPDAHKLIEDSSTRRRRWLDWAVFHVEHGFAGSWARYQRALAQRNAALRVGRTEVDVWDHELAREGEAMALARQRVLTALHPYWMEIAAELTDLPITLDLQPGWDQSLGLGEALAAVAQRDRDRRTTTVGPHRADLSLKVRGKLAREVLSRGQQKLAAVALNLCQLEYLKREHGLRPTLLLDDPSAELDRERLSRFIGRVTGLECQVIVAALDRDTPLFGAPETVFHVEQGRVFQV